MELDLITIKDLNLDPIIKVFQPFTLKGRGMKLTLFRPGEEEEWRQLMEEQAHVLQIIRSKPSVIDRIKKYFQDLPDIDLLLQKVERKEGISFTEWFSLKKFLWIVFHWSNFLEKEGFCKSLYLEADEFVRCSGYLQKLNPEAQLHPSFSLHSNFDPRLRKVREECRKLEAGQKKKREKMMREIEDRTGIQRNMLFEWVVEKGSNEEYCLRRETNLSVSRETTYECYFQLDIQDEAFLEQQRKLSEEQKEVEEDVMRHLSTFFQPTVDFLTNWLRKLVYFDVLLARVRAGITWRGVKSTLATTSLLIEGAIHPNIEKHLQENGKRMTPIDFSMEPGVSTIVGPNMGGKSVSLKTIGAIAVLHQLGFYVPAKKCELPLFSWIGTVLSDNQSIENGLSSYGAEIIRLKTWINRQEKGLLLMDELGRSTNPIEGSVLTQAVVRYLLKEKPWAILVTHYNEVLEIQGIQPYRIVGMHLHNKKMEKEDLFLYLIENMDYRLAPMKEGEKIPEQALLIARLLGLSDQIIKDAESVVKEREEAKKNGSVTDRGASHHTCARS